MFKNAITLTCLFMHCFVAGKTQQLSKGVTVIMKMQLRYSGMAPIKLENKFYVKDGFILEPVELHYSSDEIKLSTNSGVISRKELASGIRLKWYCFTNLQEMMGMSFDLDSMPSPNAIVPYQYSREKAKPRGNTFVPEPYLSEGLSVSDYSKGKDTVINGQKCFFITRNKTVEFIHKGKKMPKVVKFCMAINPAFKSYALPFVSEKIVEHFGGGAIVYVDGATEDGSTSTLEYVYSDFTSAETKLFEQYKDLYNSNKTLLAPLKKK
ncbi:hypothetical protein [Pedobacter sp. GR22-6]|uniref:hypothetical protein n=1 Tax=Pedobacter sp. GR22-6 TaxID=3127957 RepID=UPI00307E208B